MKSLAALALAFSLAAAPALAGMSIPPPPAIYGHLHLATNQTGLANNALVTVALDTVDFDSAGICNTTTHVCTVAVAGRYYIVCAAQLNLAGNGVAGDNLVVTNILRNGATVASYGAVNYAQTTISALSINEGAVSGIMNLAAGQTFSCGGKVNVAGFTSATVLGGGDTAMNFNYLGP